MRKIFVSHLFSGSVSFYLWNHWWAKSLFTGSVFRMVGKWRQPVRACGQGPGCGSGRTISHKLLE